MMTAINGEDSVDGEDGESDGRTKNERNKVEKTGRMENRRRTIWNVIHQVNYITCKQYCLPGTLYYIGQNLQFFL